MTRWWFPLSHIITYIYCDSYSRMAGDLAKSRGRG